MPDVPAVRPFVVRALPRCDPQLASWTRLAYPQSRGLSLLPTYAIRVLSYDDSEYLRVLIKMNPHPGIRNDVPIHAPSTPAHVPSFPQNVHVSMVPSSFHLHALRVYLRGTLSSSSGIGIWCVHLAVMCAHFGSSQMSNSSVPTYFIVADGCKPSHGMTDLMTSAIASFIASPASSLSFVITYLSS